MDRVSRRTLDRMVSVLSDELGRPADVWTAITSEGERRRIGQTHQANVGALDLGHANGGYQLDEIVSGSGATSNVSPRLSGSEMDLFLRGMLATLSLQRRSRSR